MKAPLVLNSISTSIKRQSRTLTVIIVTITTNVVFQSVLRLCETQNSAEQQLRFGNIAAQCRRHIVVWPRGRPPSADGRRPPVAGFRFRSADHNNTVEETEQRERRLRHVRRSKCLVIIRYVISGVLCYFAVQNNYYCLTRYVRVSLKSPGDRFYTD